MVASPFHQTYAEAVHSERARPRRNPPRSSRSRRLRRKARRRFLAQPAW
jgi:hypothetical protein